MTRYQILQGFKLFEGLKEDELKAIAELAHEENFEVDEVIFEEGKEAQRVYLVLEGGVALRFRLPARPLTRETTIDTMGKGEAFGWSTLVSPHRLTATAICTEPTKCLAFRRADLHQLFQENNHIGYVVMEHLATLVARRLRNVRLQLIREVGQSLIWGW